MSHVKKNNVNATDYTGKTVLGHAAQIGAFQDMMYLLKIEGINVNHQDSNGMSPLIIATANNQLKAVKILLDDYRTDINLYDHSRMTALDHAKWYLENIVELKPADAIVKMLVSAGAKSRKQVDFDWARKFKDN